MIYIYISLCDMWRRPIRVSAVYDVYSARLLYERLDGKEDPLIELV